MSSLASCNVIVVQSGLVSLLLTYVFPRFPWLSFKSKMPKKFAQQNSKAVAAKAAKAERADAEKAKKAKAAEDALWADDDKQKAKKQVRRSYIAQLIAT